MDQHYLTTLVLVGCTLLCEFLTNFNDSFLFEKVKKVAGVQSTDRELNFCDKWKENRVYLLT